MIRNFELRTATFALTAFLGLSLAAGATNNNNNNCNGNNGNHGNNNNGCNHGGNHGGHHGNKCKHNNKNLTCDAGGPYVVEAQAGLTVIALDGTDSDNATSFLWSTSCPDAFLDDPTSPTPHLVIPGGSECGLTCSVTLRVSKGNNTKECSAQVKLKDQTPPTIVCPETAKVICGEDTSPSVTGFPVVTDNCDPCPKVTYKDKIEQQACAAERFDHVIKRTWKAVDNKGNVTTCVQTIDVLKILTSLDVLPGQCPNEYSVNSCGGYLPVTILGSATFDVTEIKKSSIRLYGEHCVGGPVKPANVCFGDVGTPFFGGGGLACNCHDANGDGFLDLTAWFKRSELNGALDLGTYAPGEAVRVVVIGKLDDCEECKFIATDCIRIQ